MLDFYGLRERPFTLLPNPRFMYLAQREAWEYAAYRAPIDPVCDLAEKWGNKGLGESLGQYVCESLGHRQKTTRGLLSSGHLFCTVAATRFELVTKGL